MIICVFIDCTLYFSLGFESNLGVCIHTHTHTYTYISFLKNSIFHFHVKANECIMKRFKLGLVLLAFVAMTGIANAGGVGYIDYLKVIDNYDNAKKAI